MLDSDRFLLICAYARQKELLAISPNFMYDCLRKRNAQRKYLNAFGMNFAVNIVMMLVGFKVKLKIK